MIEKNYDTIASVYRLESAPGDTRIYGNTPALTVRGIAMPPSAEDEALLEGAYDEVVKFFCEISDVRKSDKIEIGTKEYFVGGLRIFDKIVKNKHMELILYLPNG